MTILNLDLPLLYRVSKIISIVQNCSLTHKKYLQWNWVFVTKSDFLESLNLNNPMSSTQFLNILFRFIFWFLFFWNNLDLTQMCNKPDARTKRWELLKLNLISSVFHFVPSVLFGRFCLVFVNLGVFYNVPYIWIWIS